MELWEQRIKGSCKRMEGWSVRENKGGVLVAFRPKGGISEAVRLPAELSWTEACEEDVIAWVRALHREWGDGALTLKAALERLKPKSDKLGEAHAAGWSDIVEAYRVRLMEHGSRIQLGTWQKNYLVYLEAALEVLAKQRPKDGATLLRLTAKRWADHYSARAVCVSCLKGFMLFANRRFNVPDCWLIDEFDAGPIRGEAPEKIETAALTDGEILQLLDAVEKRWGEGWRCVITTLTALGIRPFELGKIEARRNEDGELQMWSSYRKAGGKSRTKPRWLEEVPLQAADGSQVAFGIAERWETMPWPQTRDGARRVLSAHYVEQYLKKVPYWHELREQYGQLDLNVVPYSLRNSWNTRAKRLGLPDAMVSRAFGNTMATNLRSYRQATDADTRAAFREALAS